MSTVPLAQFQGSTLEYPNTKTGVTVQEIKDGHLWGINLEHPVTGRELPATAIWRRLRSIEDRIELGLGIRFRPTRVRCEPTPEDPKDSYDEIEPAYDYYSVMQDTYRWGYLRLRLGPITDVTEVIYGFPNRAGSQPIPREWIKLEGTFGFLRIAANAGTAIGQVQSMILGALGAGGSLPQSIFVTYKVGQTPEWWRSNHSQLLHNIGELVAVDILRLMAAQHASEEGSSLSVSADGLSHSTSGAHDAMMKAAKERADAAEAGIETWKQQFLGVMVTFL